MARQPFVLIGAVVVLACATVAGVSAVQKPGSETIELTLTAPQQEMVKGKGGTVEITLTDKQLKEIRRQFPGFNAEAVSVEAAHVRPGDKVTLEWRGNDFASMSAAPTHKLGVDARPTVVQRSAESIEPVVRDHLAEIQAVWSRFSAGGLVGDGLVDLGPFENSLAFSIMESGRVGAPQLLNGFGPFPSPLVRFDQAVRSWDFGRLDGAGTVSAQCDFVFEFRLGGGGPVRLVACRVVGRQ